MNDIGCATYTVWPMTAYACRLSCWWDWKDSFWQPLAFIALQSLVAVFPIRTHSSRHKIKTYECNLGPAGKFARLLAFEHLIHKPNVLITSIAVKRYSEEILSRAAAAAYKQILGKQPTDVQCKWVSVAGRMDITQFFVPIQGLLPHLEFFWIIGHKERHPLEFNLSQIALMLALQVCAVVHRELKLPTRLLQSLYCLSVGYCSKRIISNSLQHDDSHIVAPCATTGHAT